MLVFDFENRWWAVSENSKLYILLDISAGLDRTQKKNDTEHVSNPIKISFYVLSPPDNWATYKNLMTGHKFQKDWSTAFLINF